MQQICFCRELTRRAERRDTANASNRDALKVAQYERVMPNLIHAVVLVRSNKLTLKYVCEISYPMSPNLSSLECS